MIYTYSYQPATESYGWNVRAMIVPRPCADCGEIVAGYPAGFQVICAGCLERRR